MKRTLSLAATALAVVTLAACSSASGAPASQAPVAVTSPSPVPTVQPTPVITPVPTPAGAEPLTTADVAAALATEDCSTILAVTGDEARLAATADQDVLTAGLEAAGRCLTGAYVDPDAAPAKATSYTKPSSRTWAKIVKSPDSYTGKGFVVWACINQFDAATGEDHFLGDGSYKNLGDDYWLDGENTMFTGDAAKLADFVEDDIVVMNVTSLGSYSYDTQAGGNTTVPSFQVDKITRKGHC